MKKNYFLFYLLMIVFSVSAQDLKISGVIDGPLSGGTPKAVELYVINDIINLSLYGIGSANNGGGTDNEEFTLPAESATAGSFIYIASEETQSVNYLGFAPDYVSSAANVNGDDAIELFYQGNVIDVFGNINIDGNGTPWEYLDGWAYRKNNTGPDGNTFNVDNWTFSGANALDGETSNATATFPFPFGSLEGGNVDLIANPSNFNTTVLDTDAISLAWALNTNNDAIILATSTNTITANLIDGETYAIGNTLSDGSTIISTGTNISFDHLELSANTEYFYKIWSIDASDTYSTGLSTSARTISDTPIEANLIITGVIDGPLSGGTPKAVEIYATADIADLSLYGIGSANNGGGTDGQEFTFPSDAIQAGEYFYVATDVDNFNAYLGFDPDYTSGALGINGDDAVELFFNGNVIDVFGDINVDGNGTPWEYLDGWAYRKDEIEANNGSFNSDNWKFSGANALDGELTNATSASRFPLKSYGPDLLITGIIDGPLSGGTPKAVELYARESISDLSLYGFGSANNGGGSDGIEFTFPSVAVSANTYIYISTQTEEFTTYFGFAPDFTSSSVGINGDDAVELFYNNEVIDTFGDINVDGTGQAWEYLDGWAYRKDGTLNKGSFVLDDWTYSGTNVLDGSTTNNSATSPFPIGTYGGGNGSTENPENITINSARNATEGTLVSITGVLTVADEFSGSAYLQDETGAIAIFDEKVHGEGVFQVGDSITIVGTRSSFNEQIQISPVIEVINNGLPNNPITPKEITLSELAQHPGQLVKITNVTFPRPNDLLFGNSNYLITDTSGNGELRIDNDVTALTGLAQPETCGEVIGVVGKFFEIYQLLPRNRTDLACAEPYEAPALPIEINADKTLDITTWNIEWFGDEGNSPAIGSADPDSVQKDSVKAIINRIKPDVLAVQEITDEALFATMVSELSGYDYILSPATSYPNDPGVSQKVGFIYKTEIVNVTETKVLLETIHPYYNGGDTSFLTNYPSDADRFYASGRLPFLMSANVTIDDTTVDYDFVVLHARANSSSDSQGRYNMRKYDVEVLRDSLNTYYSEENLILLGDFNDDVDETVADNVSSTLSTYDAYVNDTSNFDILTDVLSEQGFRSYAFRENMIDHILVSNELSDNYIEQSAQVHYEVYDNDYTQTASDHFPVSVRMLLKPLTLDSVAVTDITCYGENNGTATVNVSGGISPYSYSWSNGASTANVTGLPQGDYSVTITDALLNSITESIAILEPNQLVINTTADTTVYFGYDAESCTTLSVLDVLGGEGDYMLNWSTGESNETITVCPQSTTVYTVTATDATGCSISKEIIVEVIDVRCGNKSDKVMVCHNGKMICISANAVQAHLNHGDTLGNCESTESANNESVTVYPNPVVNYVTVTFNSPVANQSSLVLFDQNGIVIQEWKVKKKTTSTELDLGSLNKDLYFLNFYEKDELKNTIRLLKE